MINGEKTKIKFFKRTFIVLSVLVVVLTQAVVVFAGFVRREGTQFYLDGNTFYFAGANSYDLFTFGDGGNYTDPDQIENQFMDKARIDAHMAAMQRNGVKVVRIWGFSHEVWHGFEPNEGQYYEPQFMLFDYILQSAEAHGIKVIVVLENYWEAYGGIDVRLQWEGLPSGTHAARTQFFRNQGCKDQYKNYVAHFVNRVNHYDGTKYIDDPTIFSWELMNEPRYQDGGEDTTGTTLRAWVDEMAGYIKSLDPNHMVSTGLEGHGTRYNFGGDEGNPFIYIHQSPYIDFTTAHPYPTEEWADLTLSETLDLISQWISDSHNIVGKPFVMEEHNVHKSRVNRSTWWQGMYDRLYNDRGDGDCFWWFQDRQVDSTFGVMDGDSELAIFKAHSDRMTALNGTINGSPNTPSQPSGPAEGDVAISYTYSTSTTDPDGDNIRYTFDWNDGTTTTTGYVTSGTTISASHSWAAVGTYYIKVKAQDNKGAESSWSTSVTVVIGGGDITPPAPPTGISVVDAEVGGQLDLSWTNPTDTDFSHIHIYRSTTSGQLGSLIYDNIATTSQSDTGLTNGTIYYYTLRSVDTSGNESTNTDQYSAIPTGVPYLYDFESGTQSWVNDTSVYFANNLGTPSSSNIYAQKGVRSLSYPLDLDVKYTNGEINDAGFVNPSPAKDLSTSDGITLYVLVPSSANIPLDKPAKCSVYVKTGSSWSWFESDNSLPISLGSWNSISIDFSSCRNSDGQQGQTVTNLQDVREIGVHLTGASTSSGTTTFYVDSVKPALETIANNPPNTPSTPSGPDSVIVATSNTYSSVTTDSDGDTIKYTFDWGDGSTTDTGYLNSGITASASHIWANPGNYNIRVKATDSKGVTSSWSSSLAVAVQGDMTPPAPPSNVQVTDPATGGTLNLSWTNPTDTDFSHIHIYRSTTSGQLGSLVYDNIATTSQSDTGLTNGTIYYYTLRSVDTSGNESTNTTQYSGMPTVSVNLALNKTAYASSNDGYAGPPSSVCDGNMSTRWASAYSDPQWIYVDLGSQYNINKVILRWETAYGKAYQIQISNDAVNWNSVYTTTNGDGGVDEIPFSATNSRYVRMYGTQRGTEWGYSIWEFEIYGPPQSDTTPPAPPINVQVTDPQTGDQLNLSWINPTDGDFNHIHIYRSTTSVQLGSLVYDNITGTDLQDSGLTEGVTYYYTLRSVDTVGNESTNTDQYSGVPTRPTNVNLALNKNAYASSNDGHAGPPSSVCDGNMRTRWASAYSDPQWIYIDLTAQYEINKVILYWEKAYGKAYQIQVSNNATNWTTVYSTNNEDGGTDEIIFTRTNTRYVRMYGTQRGTKWGYSLWEFEIYAPSDNDTTPPAAPANISVTDAGVGGQLKVSWTNPTDADFNHINIYRSVTSGQIGNLVYDNVTGTSLEDTGLTNGIVYYYTLRSVDNNGNESINTEQHSGIPTAPTNLAVGQPAYASSNDGYAGSPSSVCDGNMNTRWASSWGNDQWIYIDLGANYDFNNVVLYWEAAYGRSYRIEVSNNAINWTTVFSTTSGDGGKDVINFATTNARYVRMYGVKKATRWGFSIWEFEIYNLSSPQASIDTLVNEIEIKYKAKGRPEGKIITPNNDGTNDTADFNLTGSFNIKIYDVTGQLVRSIDNVNSWDGKNDNGDVVRNGIYIYQYDYNGEKVSGTVAVAR